jgi:hypothetical protein
MHLDIIVEGIKDQVDDFENWWSTRIIPMKTISKDGKEQNALIQIALRKRQAYSLIFPKEMLDVVLNTLNPENCEVSRVDGKGTKQWGLMFKTLRKLLKLKKLPKRDLTKGIMPMRPFRDVRVVALGTREDGEVTEADGGTHEGL